MSTKSVIVKKTVQTLKGNGKSKEAVVYSPSEKPQDLPVDLANEGLKKGWAVEPEVEETEDASEGGTQDDSGE